MIKAVIFDMDGLMINSEPIQSLAFEEVISKLGKVPQKNPNGLIQTLGITERENWVKLKAHHGIKEDIDVLIALRQPLYAKLLAEKIQAMPGLYDLLDRLENQKIKLAVASSSSLEIIRSAIEAISCEHYFDALVTGTELAHGKPHPEIFLKTARILEVNPSSCLVLEDSESGVIASRSAGMKVFAVKNQYTLGQDFSQANRVLDSLSEIGDELKKTA